jgi:hypothetical protein
MSGSSAVNISVPALGVSTYSTQADVESIHTGRSTLPATPGATPFGTAVFSFNQNGATVTEAGVPTSPPTTAARIFIDYRTSVDAIPARISVGTIDINTGIATVNSVTASANVTYTLRNIAGATLSTGHGTLAAGAHFAGELINGLPAGFTGVLDIVSTMPFAAFTMRSLTNERDDFLMATFPISDMTMAAPSPIIFPHIADGGGYMSQFILIGAGGASDTTLNYYGEDGTPLAVGK